MIELRNVSFSYDGGKECIRDVNLKIEDNECVVLMGCSGNGKTTLTRLINGLAPAYYTGKLTGEILIDGRSVCNVPQWQRARMTGSVFQDPKSQFFSSELAGEIAFACENIGLPTEEVRARTDGMIREMALEHLVDTPIDRLSSGEKQKTAIASVRTLSPNIYVFDEPSANLDVEAASQLAEWLAGLKALGHTLVIAEHRLHYLADIADRFFYIENGRQVKSYTKAELSALSDTERIKMGIRSLQKLSFPKLSPPAVSSQNHAAVELNHIVYRVKEKEILIGAALCACPGQIVAVTGKNGAGKTTLAKIMCGLLKETEGRVCFFGKPIKARYRWKRTWYSANDTNTQFFTESVEKEVLLLSPQTPDTIEHAREVLKAFSLYEYKDRHPATLSGGEKQLLSLACGLLSNRGILILDEPTSGLDGRNMRHISDALKYAAAQGKTIFVITHDSELARMCCTHVYQLDEQQKI